MSYKQNSLSNDKKRENDSHCKLENHNENSNINEKKEKTISNCFNCDSSTESSLSTI